MSDLKPLDQWTVQDHVNYKRRGSAANPNPDRGRPPRVGEGGPTREELEEAGLRVKPRTGNRFNTAIEGSRDTYGLRSMHAQLSRFEQDLAYATSARLQRIDGTPRFARIAQLQARIAEQQAEIAKAQELKADDDRADRDRAGAEERRKREAGPPPGYAFVGDGGDREDPEAA
jgi:hypothetical protein